MTDRVSAIVVTLAPGFRVDDPVIQASLTVLRGVEGVVSAEPMIDGIEQHIADERAKRELREKLWEVLR